MSRQDFLVEIGTEELPPAALATLSNSFKDNVTAALEQAGINFNHCRALATPRRLALLISELETKQQDKIIERRGPAVKAAFDNNGKPTPAAQGFAQSCNTTVDKLDRISNDKGSWLFYKFKQPGTVTKDLLAHIIEQALRNLPIPKLMRWNSGDYAFIRPVHWIVMLFGNKIVAAELFGIKASNLTYGHRFHHPQAIKLQQPTEYLSALEKAYVMADFEQRKNKIKQQIEKTASKYGNPIINAKLLNEVTGLVEWPVALLGEFPQKFLKLPAEIIVTSLEKHQKCFAIETANNKLAPYFITISNIKSSNPKRVIAGNCRVINARLTDAEFFYHTDLQQPLNHYAEMLQKVVFQHKLGSIADKSNRVMQLSLNIGGQLNANLEQIKRAASLCKADLATSMVGEFPELQGIIGYYYALKQHEDKAVATAIKEHYLPRFAGDALPKSHISASLAIADRIDTLVGIFGINQAPTGDKDPFALRRATLGVLRIIIEQKLDLDLQELISQGAHNYPIKFANNNFCAQTLDFMLERLRAWYLESGVSPQTFAAVLARFPTKPLDFAKRIAAVTKFQTLPEAESLASANKRVANILKKNRQPQQQLDEKLLIEPAERALAKAVQQQTKTITPLSQAGNYTKALTTLATLKPVVDDFFDNVLVMSEDKKLAANRIALLQQLRDLFLQVADISLLQQ